MIKKKPYSRVRLFKHTEIEKLVRAHGERVRANIEHASTQFNMLINNFQLFHKERSTVYDNYIAGIESEYEKCLVMLAVDNTGENVTKACGWLIVKEQMIQEDHNAVNRQIEEENEHLNFIREKVEKLDIEDIEDELSGKVPVASIFRRTVIDSEYFINRLVYFGSNEFFENVKNNIMFQSYAKAVKKAADSKKPAVA